MEKEPDIFNRKNLEFINSMIEEKILILKQCEDFRLKYEKLFDSIDYLEKNITG